MSIIKQIVKRDGTTVAYDRDRIGTAIFKAAAAVGGSDRAEADRLAALVEKKLEGTYGSGGIPSVEDRVNLLYTHGVCRGRIDLQTFVDAASTQAAIACSHAPTVGPARIRSGAPRASVDVACANAAPAAALQPPSGTSSACAVRASNAATPNVAPARTSAMRKAMT